MLDQPVALFVALCVSAAVALTAWKLRSLSLAGAAAATAVGTCALHVSRGWGAYLIVWFVLATALSKVGRAKKAQRVGAIVAKSANRDAWQVLANGGVFAAAALFVLFERSFGGGNCLPDSLCHHVAAVVAAASLAAAGADTWATEIGTLWGKVPWSLRTGAPAPPGTSGAITPIGIMAMLVASAILAALAAMGSVIPWEVQPALAVAIGGASGAMADTLLGAWVQERRWCASCGIATEQLVHWCGTHTAHHGGLRGIGNDVVNVFCTVVGALVALLLMLV